MVPLFSCENFVEKHDFTFNGLVIFQVLMFSDDTYTVSRRRTCNAVTNIFSTKNAYGVESVFISTQPNGNSIAHPSGGTGSGWRTVFSPF